METSKTLSGNLTREQATIFRELERLRITDGFHDRVAPEFLVAIFLLHRIQKDLESERSALSTDIQKVSDRIGTAIHEFLALLDPATDNVPTDPVD